MCRIVKVEDNAHVYGVLTDYNLSSWGASLKSDYTKTSQQRTGAPPYMAYELLRGESDIHLYRHDVESLFYIMLSLCARHEFDSSKEAKWSVVMREGRLPYQDWFNEPNYAKLGIFKIIFFADMQVIELSPAFEDFRLWLLSLRRSFSRGFSAKQYHNIMQETFPEDEQMEGVRDESPPPPFDDETLGGHVSYSAVIGTTRHLKGELKDLAIRYKLPSPTPTTPANPVYGDA